VGCIPSKALLHAAAVIDEAAHADDFGVSSASRPSTWTSCARTRKVVGQLTKGLAGMAKQRKVRTVQGVGVRFAARAGNHRRRRQHPAAALRECIIAAGSQAVKLPNFPWDDPRVMDSTDALELEVPAKLLVVGGGIIGLEMATVYARWAARSPWSSSWTS
jgi:dihydrolipoamide dehydrogenase